MGDDVEEPEWQVSISRSLRSGTFPFWSPHSFGGQPFFANGSSAGLYPPRLLAAVLLPPDWAHDALSAFHVLVAGMGMWFLLRELRLGVPASLLGSVAWMLSRIRQRRRVSFALPRFRLIASLLVVAATAACSGGSGRAAGSGAIEVVDAIYGRNCGGRGGNATASVARACNGRLNCDYEVRFERLGDPAQGCAKDFVVGYRCSAATPLRRVRVDAEAGFGSVASLTCE